MDVVSQKFVAECFWPDVQPFERLLETTTPDQNRRNEDA